MDYNVRRADYELSVKTTIPIGSLQSADVLKLIKEQFEGMKLPESNPPRRCMIYLVIETYLPDDLIRGDRPDAFASSSDT